jgi:hypothetical protein
MENIEYAQIIDESTMIGSEKLLLTLGVPAEHQGRPLNCGDVSILDMAVAGSRNDERIGRCLIQSPEKAGHAPNYVISDNASTVNKGVRCAQFKHQHDISHSPGMYPERTYKKAPDFNEYIKLMTIPEFKYSMKKVACLLPPKQHTVSRFINMSQRVERSSKMLSVYDTLQDSFFVYSGQHFVNK